MSFLPASLGLWGLVGFTALLLALMMLGMRLYGGRTSRTVTLRPGFLGLVVGLRGHGKSLFVARLIHERLQAGVEVWANFTVSGGAKRMEEWRDVILAPAGSMVILDEAPNWAGARSGVTLRPAAAWYVSQSRKLGHELWLVAQHENQIAGAVRDQVNELVLCKRMPRGWHRAASYAPHEFRKRDAKPLWAWWYQPNGPAVTVYDTMDLVPPERSRGRSFDEDYAMIDDCIRIIRSRDTPKAGTGSVLDVASVDAWLESAGVS